MGLIRVLPESIANRIAAGEVIERPASIVKELVENSLDAGATKIEISIRHGGKSLIRVADDGCGMGPDDAELAFQRHATSKIREADDLDRIASYGFRGEALPSIGAVSRTKMISRMSERPSGTEVVVEGGRLVQAKECPSAPGTVIEVRDLFFNTPARRKFLKSDATETGHVTDMISNIAFSRKDVHFVFKSADKQVFDLLPAQNLKDRAAVLLGDETAKHLVEIEGESGGVKVWGVIGKPAISRANRYGQSIFVNQRWIKSVNLSYAIQNGYHGLLMQGQYPVAVLFIECDLSRVDVNVHPTKQEVRISNEIQVKFLIKQIIEEKLRKEGDLAPSIHPIPSPGGGKSPPLPEFLNPSISRSLGQGRGLDSQKTFSEEMGVFKEEVLSGGKPEMMFQAQGPEVFPEAISLRDQFRITKILGQIHHTFILAETEEGMIIIDQHAAHERVQYETLMKVLESGFAARQKLLMEEVLELAPKYRESMQESLGMLGKLGFEIEEFGENTFVVRAVPSILNEENVTVLLKRFLEEREEGKLGTSLESYQENVAALIACKKKSVKAHDAMTPEAIKGLLEQLSKCVNPFNCPHGRPSFLKYSFNDLEKQFKRKL